MYIFDYTDQTEKEKIIEKSLKIQA